MEPRPALGIRADPVSAPLGPRRRVRPRRCGKVCRGKVLAGEDILNLLGQLVDKSLVLADTDDEGSVRYRLLETLRQYGRERLIEAAEEEDALAAHFAYFLEFAERVSG